MSPEICCNRSPRGQDGLEPRRRRVRHVPSALRESNKVNPSTSRPWGAVSSAPGAVAQLRRDSFSRYQMLLKCKRNEPRTNVCKLRQSRERKSALFCPLSCFPWLLPVPGRLTQSPLCLRVAVTLLGEAERLPTVHHCCRERRWGTGTHSAGQRRTAGFSGRRRGTVQNPSSKAGVPLESEPGVRSCGRWQSQQRRRVIDLEMSHSEGGRRMSSPWNGTTAAWLRNGEN